MADKKTKEKRQEELTKKLSEASLVLHNAYLEEIVHAAKKKDDYIVTVAFETAEGMYELQTDGDLDWETPEGFGHMHVAIVVQDRDDKRFVPFLEVSARIYDNESNLVTESDAYFMWHPYLYHYGFDTVIPDEGKYTVEITIKKPAFGRHNKSHGNRYAEDVTLKLGPVQLMPPGGDSEEDIMNA